MLRHLLLLPCTILCSAFVDTEIHAQTASASAETVSQPRDVSAELDTILQKHKVPALVAVVVDGDHVSATGAAGFRRKGSEELVTIDDKFHIGSCTKAMTATLIAMLVDDGTMAWETTIGDTFPELREAMKPAWTDVTVSQLLCNCAGAPHRLDQLDNSIWSRQGTPQEMRTRLVRAVLEQEPEAEPGTEFIYSNAGFAIAGAMAEKLTGTPWESLMRERLFEPLSMDSADFGAPGTVGRLDQPRGHREDSTVVEPGPEADNTPAIGPGGTAHMAIGDWAKFVSIHLKPARAENKLKISAESFKKLHTPQPGPDAHYAMGWEVTKRSWGDGTVLTHNGSNTMWFAVTWLSPNQDFAVLVCTNQGGADAAAATDDVAAMLIRLHSAEKSASD